MMLLMYAITTETLSFGLDSKLASCHVLSRSTIWSSTETWAAPRLMSCLWRVNHCCWRFCDFHLTHPLKTPSDKHHVYFALSNSCKNISKWGKCQTNEKTLPVASRQRQQYYGKWRWYRLVDFSRVSGATIYLCFYSVAKVKSKLLSKEVFTSYREISYMVLIFIDCRVGVGELVRRPFLGAGAATPRNCLCLHSYLSS